jgi:hypothetical protein
MNLAERLKRFLSNQGVSKLPSDSFNILDLCGGKNSVVGINAAKRVKTTKPIEYFNMDSTPGINYDVKGINPHLWKGLVELYSAPSLGRQIDSIAGSCLQFDEIHLHMPETTIFGLNGTMERVPDWNHAEAVLQELSRRLKQSGKIYHTWQDGSPILFVANNLRGDLISGRKKTTTEEYRAKAQEIIGRTDLEIETFLQRTWNYFYGIEFKDPEGNLSIPNFDKFSNFADEFANFYVILGKR